VSDTPTYPHSIDLIVAHTDSVLPVVMARAYLEALRDAGLGTIVEIRMPNSKRQPGTRDDLYAALERVGPDIHFFLFRAEDGTTVTCHRARGTQMTVDDHLWHVEINREGPPTEAWIEAMTKVARAAIRMPEFLYAVLDRDGGRVMAFVPRPPLARSFHLVTTNETQVAERYDDPSVFWSVWGTIETIGDVRLCTRHLDALEEQDWLARSIDDTMELARHARPNLTYYDSDPYWYPDYAPWWEPGDSQDEKAGAPALTLVGYVAETKTVEFTGLITRYTPQSSGEDPLHVLIVEIHAVRELVTKKQTDDGRPVAAVQVVFLEEWMARQERRPLLDVGAQVFYMDGKTGARVAVTD
jgi:hypothetical protein